jgi:hypothetical protein
VVVVIKGGRWRGRGRGAPSMDAIDPSFFFLFYGLFGGKRKIGKIRGRETDRKKGRRKKRMKSVFRDLNDFKENEGVGGSGGRNDGDGGGGGGGGGGGAAAAC